MSFQSEAHQQWHSIHGQFSVCPLDCGAEERAPEGYVPPTTAEFEPTDNEQCEHGLSLWLCAGPGHYPQDM